MAVDLQLPERPRGEPVVVVAVEHDGRLVVDAGAPEQLFELLHRHDVADERVAQLGRPVPAGGARHVSLIVRGRIDIHFDDADARVGGMLRDPVGGDEHVGQRGGSHTDFLLFRRAELPILSHRESFITESMRAQRLYAGVPRYVAAGRTLQAFKQLKLNIVADCACENLPALYQRRIRRSAVHLHDRRDRSGDDRRHRARAGRERRRRRPRRQGRARRVRRGAVERRHGAGSRARALQARRRSSATAPTSWPSSRRATAASRSSRPSSTSPTWRPASSTTAASRRRFTAT